MICKFIVDQFKNFYIIGQYNANSNVEIAGKLCTLQHWVIQYLLQNMIQQDLLFQLF